MLLIQFFVVLQQYHEKSVYILVAVIVVVNTFSFILRLVFHFNVIFLIILSNNKRKLRANSQKVLEGPFKDI